MGVCPELTRENVPLQLTNSAPHPKKIRGFGLPPIMSAEAHTLKTVSVLLVKRSVLG